jgi:ATP-dependent Lhr-like helicase
MTSSFKFYAVFKDSEDYTVRCESDEIGTITSPPPVGDRFALAGRVWEVTELDVQRRLVFVKSVLGKMEVSWPGDYGEIHTRILERMKQVLEEDTVYSYLLPNAQKRLDDARRLARSTGVLRRPVIHLGGFSYCIFPWLGTKAFRCYRRMLAKLSAQFGISEIEYEGSTYISFRMEKGTPESLISALYELAENIQDPLKLVGVNECPIYEKFDDLIPAELLRKAYAADKLDLACAVRRIGEQFAEINKKAEE